MSESPGSSIVVVVDGLAASWLGPYGNTWFDTPAANQLAAESLLFEQVQIESPTLPGAYAAFWQGECPLRGGGVAPLPAALSDAGVRTALLTDEIEVAELPAAEAMENHGWNPPSVATAADDAFSTAAGQVLAAACELASALPDPFCLWVHLQGLAGLWDAPWPCRAALADEEDPDPPAWVVPPAGPADPPDPDEMLGRMQAAGGQVRVIDECFSAVSEVAARRGTLLALSASRGYPLGEHGVAGFDPPQLYSDLLQAPLLVRRPDGADASVRCQQFVQGAALGHAVRQWHGLADAAPVPALPVPERQLSVSAAGEQLALRTASWFARLSGETTELFVKPDDRGEVNEVADRCEAETEAMQRLAEALRRGETPEIPALLWQPHY